MDNMDDFLPDTGGDDPFAGSSDSVGGDDPFASADLGGGDDPFASPEVDSAPAEASAFGFVADGNSQADAPVSLEAAAPAADSALSKWQEQRRAVLVERRDAARAEKEKQRDVAKQELEQMHAERKERLEGIKKQNREEEKNWHAEMETTMQFGSDWEKVTKLVNLTTPKGEKPGTSKVDRMRGLLIQLKNEKKE